ncbi:unnamed protein product [Urochloa decumbens]|uniref:Uncharacterized protein n=1 Tax=Urochloa decumbens TaxID=240449 RepID=A0ABC9E5K8_9POAL
MAPAATLLGFTLLTYNSIMAIVKSRGDAAATAFVVTSYATLLLLFYFLSSFEASPQGSAARDRARVGVWLATTMLTAMFSWRVSAVMPWPVSAGVCLMGASTVVGGFYAMFLLPTDN